MELQQEIMKERKYKALKYKTLTPANWGKRLVEQDNRRGNCEEMSCVSIHFAKSMDMNCYLASIDYPGDHIFCIVAATKPDFATIGAMAKTPADDCWVIDTWANIACASTDYMAQLREKFRVWTGQTKRIFWQKASGTNPIPVEPTNVQYVLAQLTSKLSFRGMDETFA